MQPINTNSSLRSFQVVGFLSVLLMVGVVGGWANFTELNGAVIAPATIMVESYSKKVQHKEGGIVGEIRVKDGDRVEMGQALMTMGSDPKLTPVRRMFSSELTTAWQPIAAKAFSTERRFPTP